jgi:hypothetical protein
VPTFQAHRSNHLNEIVHPTCAKCGTPMWLIRVERDEPRTERHTFECQVCSNSTSDTVKIR